MSNINNIKTIINNNTTVNEGTKQELLTMLNNKQRLGMDMMTNTKVNDLLKLLQD